MPPVNIAGGDVKATATICDAHSRNIIEDACISAWRLKRCDISERWGHAAIAVSQPSPPRSTAPAIIIYRRCVWLDGDVLP